MKREELVRRRKPERTAALSTVHVVPDSVDAMCWVFI